MTRSIQIVILLLGAFGPLASAKRIQQRVGGGDLVREVELDAVKAKNKCGEPKVEGICRCEKYSNSKWIWQCSTCIEKDKWGYGCKLQCPSVCPHSCDFSGNCVRDPCPKNCKRNSRVDKPTSEKVCVNEFGLCQACDSGWCGEMCSEACPGNCDDSPEGMCMRDGSCYKCKTGFFGPRCAKKCPSACPKCMMEDGLDDSGEQVTAGSCAQACQGDFYGGTCDQTCPANCDRTAIKKGKPSCSRDQGHCKDACTTGFWGAKCEEHCNSGCIGKDCGRSNGECKQGCVPGFWGDSCDTECPDFTDKSEGCDRSDGYPKSCDAKHFPSHDRSSKGRTSICADCPSGCGDGVCDGNGRCTKHCETGFYGPTCAKKCPKGCADGCDKETGDCGKCKPGLTGARCKDKCHSQCATCVQFSQGLMHTYPGTEKSHCLACPDDDAAELQTGSDEVCQCIPGAKRKNAKSKCECNVPEDKYFEAHFETSPKKCSVRCKENFEGEPLRPVIGDGTTKCIPQAFHNAIAVFWSEYFTGAKPEMGGGSCRASEYNIEIKDRSMCLHSEFIQYIVGKDKMQG